jgi:hypothetical protein
MGFTERPIGGANPLTSFKKFKKRKIKADGFFEKKKQALNNRLSMSTTNKPASGQEGDELNKTGPSFFQKGDKSKKKDFVIKSTNSVANKRKRPESGLVGEQGSGEDNVGLNKTDPNLGPTDLDNSMLLQEAEGEKPIIIDDQYKLTDEISNIDDANVSPFKPELILGYETNSKAQDLNTSSSEDSEDDEPEFKGPGPIIITPGSPSRRSAGRGQLDELKVENKGIPARCSSNS